MLEPGHSYEQLQFRGAEAAGNTHHRG